MVTANHHPALFREPFFILNGIGHKRKGHLFCDCPRKYIKRRTLHFQTTDLREIPVLFWPSSLGERPFKKSYPEQCAKGAGKPAPALNRCCPP